jgi:hypothetical protein
VARSGCVKELSDVHSDRDAWRSEVERLILIEYRRNERECLPWWKRLAGWAPNVVHFAGHADSDTLVFEDNKGNTTPVSLEAIADLLNRQKAECVILNACSSARNLTKAIAPYTIGMNEEIDDEDALVFSRGFYDALSAGKTYKDAYVEGVTAVKLKGGQADTIMLLTK